MPLTPYPTGADVQAHALENECGLYQAKSALEDKWAKENIAKLKADVKPLTDVDAVAQQPLESIAKAAQALLDWMELIEKAMETA